MIYKLICIISASALPFLFSLNGDFVFDDTEAVLKNPDVFSGSWTNAFVHDFWGTDIKTTYSHKSYRPLTVLTYRFNYFLNNENFSALHYKVTNLIFHITCCIIMWHAFHNITKDVCGNYRKWYEDISFLATLIFAVHPIHTEAVSGIVGRADVLAGNSFFLAVLLYQKAIRPGSSYCYLLSTLVMGAASMLFKENGVTVLGFCFCYELIRKFRIRKTKNYRSRKSQYTLLGSSSMGRLVSITAIIMYLLYARWAVMGGMKPKFQIVDNPAAFSNSFFTKIATYNYIYFLNLLLLIWPQWLCYDWSMGCVPLIQHILDYRLFFIILMYLYGLLLLLFLFGKKNKISTKKLVTLAILLTLIPFLPASNMFFPVGFVVAERILYISSAGLCLLVSLGIQKLNALERGKQYKITPVLFCLLLIFLSLKSWERAENWRTEYQLFTSGLSVCPSNAKVHYNIAKSVDIIDKQRAIDEYNEAIRLNPRYYQAMNNLGNLLKSEKRHTEAEIMFKTALTVKHDFPTAWMNLGIVLSSEKRYLEAERAYGNAIRYRKNYPDCFYNMGNLYLQMNETEKALQCWLQAVNQNSTHLVAWYNLLTLLYDTEQLDKGRHVIPQALQALPNAANLHFSAANLYGKAENYTAAEKHFKIAIKLLGDNVKAIHYANLGVLYHRWKKHPLAAEMYQKALQIDPTYAACRKYLEDLKKYK